MNAFYDAAIDAARRGLFVFPCAPGTKDPLVSWGQAATPNYQRIAEWWGMWPEANPAVAVKPSGLVVIDCDLPKPRRHPDGSTSPYQWPAGWDRPGITDGVDVLVSLFDKAGAHWLDAPMANTASGGLHVYFRHPRGIDLIPNSASRIGPLVDVRGHGGTFGGFVLWPGAVNGEGVPYTWVGGAPPSEPPPVMPPWLAALCQTPPPPERKPGADRPRVDGAGGHTGLLAWLATAQPGEQNPALYRVARDLRKEGVPYGQAVEELFDVSQQWSTSKGAWTMQDVERTVRSAYR